MKSHYLTLAAVLTINIVVMFLLTYVTIARPTHFMPNINRLYMAILMVAPMGALMLVTMRSMFENRALNYFLYGVFATVFIATFLLIRTQTPVGDRQFLRSMIPHHSGAILMCQEAAIRDPEVVALCRQIVDSQEREIAQMKAILQRY